MVLAKDTAHAVDSTKGSYTCLAIHSNVTPEAQYRRQHRNQRKMEITKSHYIDTSRDCIIDYIPWLPP